MSAVEIQEAGCGTPVPVQAVVGRESIADYLRQYRSSRRWCVIVSPGRNWDDKRVIADDLSWDEARATADRKDAEWFAAHPLHSSWTADLHFVEESKANTSGQPRLARK